MPATRPLLVAHRGASGYRPEHSRSAYELAIDMGCDAVEPDVVATRDGVLVVRHENEISGTTDVASHPEFADRRTTKSFLGHTMTGWFTEDFTWAELQTLRLRERIPTLRPESAQHDGYEPMLRLSDVLEIAADGARRTGREIGVVVEIKHDAYFRSIGSDLGALVATELSASGWPGPGRPVTIESFEPSVLERMRARETEAQYVFLLEATGSPVDMMIERGADAPTYAEIVEPAGLDRWVAGFDGISVAKSMILGPDATARAGAALVEAAHARGLVVYTWTCRPENAFLAKRFRAGGGKAAFGDYEAEWSLIRDAGVDGVFVDHTDLGAELFLR
ncbi:glycerophosphodiester phosphodiesterase family protein [Microbacterium sp. JB110]|uniref:glycerophosphodiester phosphodiesterase family protein n=1 Tax=Microbacterium sp. JB110 TaxID=2024477 RepID=UPI000B35522C|nr:glycerophosphodiester phosphodiesterase family protein [Microbacterium sp. JB110]RCS60566.1 glycerophosphodiester phosphodiesterase [Microbacterium sp. JB110]